MRASTIERHVIGVDFARLEPSRTVALMHVHWPSTMTAEEIAASRIQRSIFVADDAPPLSPEPRRARTALGYGLIAGLKGMGT